MPETDMVVLGSGAAGLAAALTEQVLAFNGHAAGGVDPVFHRGEKPWEIHNLPDHRSIGPMTEGPFVGYRVRAGGWRASRC